MDKLGFYNLLVNATLEQIGRLLWIACLLGLGAWLAFKYMDKSSAFEKKEEKEEEESFE